MQLDFIRGRELCVGYTLLLKASGSEVFHWGNVAAGSGDEWRWSLLLPVNTITVTGTSGNKCRDTETLYMMAESCFYIDMPNAFTPNGDGTNDKFVTATNGHFKNYTLSIYDRWGKRIFIGHTENKQWDRMSGTIPADIGTYHYIVTGYCMDNTPVRSMGDLMLIR